MKEKIANILLGCLFVLTIYLFIANMIHMVVLSHYEVYDFNQKEMQDIKENIQTLKQKEETIYYYLPQNSVFTADEKEEIELLLAAINKSIAENPLLTYHGKQKINATFLYQLDRDTNLYQTSIVSLLRMLEKYDSSIHEYLNLYINEFMANAYGRNELFLKIQKSYYYQNPDFYLNRILEPNNADILARIYIYNEYILKANYISDLIIKVGDLHE